MARKTAASKKTRKGVSAKKTRKVTPAKKAAPAKKGYICSTCGLVTASKGHLCSPVMVDKAYSCEYCRAVVGNPRHVCKPKAVKFSYVCDACGRVAAKKTELCMPERYRYTLVSPLRCRWGKPRGIHRQEGDVSGYGTNAYLGPRGNHNSCPLDTVRHFSRDFPLPAVGHVL